MSSKTLRPEDMEIMYSHAVREYPNECCGIILGKVGDPSFNEVRPGTNIQQQLKEQYPHLYQRDADTGYFLDPKELMAAFTDAEKRELEVTGFYHSHPNHAPYWSDEDHRAAMWAGTGEPSYPDTYHVVISIYDGIVKGAAMFLWDAVSGQFVEEPI